MASVMSSHTDFPTLITWFWAGILNQCVLGGLPKQAKHGGASWAAEAGLIQETFE